MPGRGSYGPGGKWIHDRAHRILQKGDLQERHGDDAKNVAYAIATQQAHKMGTTPKKGAGPKGMYGTRTGKRIAKAKFDKPRKEYQKTAEDLTGVNRIFEILKQASAVRSANKFLEAMEKYPALGGAVTGGAGGALAGGLLGEEGRRLETAAKLGLLGTGVGAVGFPLSRAALGRKWGDILAPGLTGAGIGGAALATGALDRKFGEKTASTAGQDLRKDFVGKPRFPTADSKTLSNQLLEKSQRAAEVGPAPTAGKVGKDSSGPTFKDAAPKMGTSAGSLPMFKKEGSEMADIKNDPLVQYLTKQASMVKKQLRGEIEEGRMNDMVQKGNQEVSDTLKALFKNRTDKAKL